MMADDTTTDGGGDALASLLADESMWAEAPAGEADAVVAAIAGDNVVALRSPRWGPRPLGVALGAAAAAIVLAVFGITALLSSSTDDAPTLEVALAGTEQAPGATAELRIVETPLGTRIDFAVTGLDPAPPGTYYEAWLRKDAETGVSAGTFHLRGGDGEIELWAGVTIADYPLVTVTLQREGDGAASSGVVVLRGSTG